MRKHFDRYRAWVRVYGDDRLKLIYAGSVLRFVYIPKNICKIEIYNLDLA